MTFAAYEQSRTLGEPLELYLFTSATQTFAYTNADDEVGYEGLTYEPVPITHSAIASSGALDKTTLTVSVAETTALAAFLRARDFSSVMSFRLRQGHAADPDKQYLVAWTGRVVSSKGLQSKRDITCQPISTGLRRNGLRRNWQLGCPHVLYGDRCRASKAAATVSVYATNGGGNTLNLTAGWNAGKPTAKFAGGLFAWGGEVRTILRVVSDTQLLLSAAVPFSGGQTVALSLGCDHQTDDCRTIHVPVDEAPYGGGNIHNFGGMPYIPQKTPIGFVSNY